MASRMSSRLAHAWNAFTNRQEASPSFAEYGAASYGVRPDRPRFMVTNERSIVSAVIMRMGIDAASVDMMHVRLDENDRYLETIDSGLNNCLTLEANIDQGSRAFMQDLFMTLCDKGVIAVVPTDTSISPLSTGGFDIRTLRVGEVVTWYPEQVTVRVYNQKTGLKEDITLPKTMVAIIENPLYMVMNEQNSTLQRLIRKLVLLDAIDDQTGSGKLDLIIQLPYVVKSEVRKQQAEQRRTMIESQLKGSKYGIAYTDGTEKITQLNRPAENNLLAQIEWLTEQLYGQLGITDEVMKGTADEKTMLNYYNRTIEPLLGAVAQGLKRTFLTKTARSQRQSVVYIRDPFKLVSIADLAEIADKFTRNEIATGNEFRGFIGMRPSKDPSADELRNKNIPEPVPEPAQIEAPAPTEPVSIEPPPNRLAIEAPRGSRVREIMEGQ